MATSLHEQLKTHYVEDKDRHEVKLDGYRIDAIDSDQRLIEIQCASLLAIRDKIRDLTKSHQVVVVKPLAARRKLLKKARRNGKVVSSRYSPLRQSLPDIFDELVHFTGAFPHPNLQLDVVMTDQTEVRVPAKRKTWRRKHSVQDRGLIEVQHTYRLTTAHDLWTELGICVPDVFTTADIAESTEMPRWQAQKAAWCFRNMDHIEACGKQGNAIQYQLKAQTERQAA